MECPHVPITNYGDFSKRLHDKVADQRIPISGSIEMTARCNLRCVHCYINLPTGDQRALKRELSSREFFNLIDQIVDEGCLWLLLTGGEPFVRLDFLDIYTYAKKKGLLITLFTNGTLITPSIADHLAKWRPFSIEITLYGRSQKTYEKITGVSGSHKRCIRGIELLLDRNLPLKLKSMVLTLNKHEIWDMKAYAESLGLEFRFDPVLNVRIDGDKTPAKFRISPQDTVALDLAEPKRMIEWHDFCDKFSGPPSQSEYLYHCGAGINTFHVDSYGQMSPCEMSRIHSYNLRQGAFRDGWHNFMPQVRKQKRSREEPCKNCDLIGLCGQCPGWAYMEHGDPEKPVEYLCRIAHLRAKAFGLTKRQEEKDDQKNENQGNPETLLQT